MDDFEQLREQFVETSGRHHTPRRRTNPPKRPPDPEDEPAPRPSERKPSSAIACSALFRERYSAQPEPDPQPARSEPPEPEAELEPEPPLPAEVMSDDEFRRIMTEIVIDLMKMPVRNPVSSG